MDTMTPDFATAPPAPEPAPAPEPIPRPKHRLRIIAGAVVVLGLAGAGAVALTGGKVPVVTKPATHALTGKIEVSDDSFSSSHTAGASCDGSDISSGYSDMRPGADVVVTDASGKVLATGMLTDGTWSSGYNGTSLGRSCDLTINVANIPDSDFYGVEVGHRGKKVYSRAELDTEAWTLGLSLG